MVQLFRKEVARGLVARDWIQHHRVGFMFADGQLLVQPNPSPPSPRPADPSPATSSLRGGKHLCLKLQDSTHCLALRSRRGRLFGHPAKSARSQFFGAMSPGKVKMLRAPGYDKSLDVQLPDSSQRCQRSSGRSTSGPSMKELLSKRTVYQHHSSRFVDMERMFPF